MQWRCETCDYWEWEHGYERGECHLNPPTHSRDETPYPMTYATDWCSHYHNAAALSIIQNPGVMGTHFLSPPPFRPGEEGGGVRHPRPAPPPPVLEEGKMAVGSLSLPPEPEKA